MFWVPVVALGTIYGLYKNDFFGKKLDNNDDLEDTQVWDDLSLFEKFRQILNLPVNQLATLMTVTYAVVSILKIFVEMNDRKY